MEIPSWLDEDVIGNPMYWLLTAGAELALMIGFKLQSQWGTELSMPIYSKIITLALIPVASYFVTMKISR